ncbi:unnamed protein product [Clonostachys rhizophaga]|uniref:Uncharacterized protein n=1 Tax=Clonostachys rhizophaga TaxID=160324 RepID=A0A9N9VCM7_9HYPO|nr:unnamed protein product [Clonostachys rhizophaga]
MSCLVPSFAFEVQCHVDLRSCFAQKGNFSHLGSVRLSLTPIILTAISSQYKALFKRTTVSQNIDSPIFSPI